MRKSFIKIITIIFVSFISCGCGEKEILTPNAFSAILKNRDFQIVDLSEQYKNNKKINTVVIGKNKDYQIEYFIMKNEEDAINLFEENIKYIKDNNAVSETKKEGTNYQKNIFISKQKYYAIVKVAHTFLYAEADVDNIEEIDEVLEEMNY